MRPSFDEYYLGIALAASARGDCTRSQVGAVIVLRTSRGHLTSLGYNGVEAGTAGCLEGACPRGRLSYGELPSNPDYSNCISTHAEINAFYNAQFDIEYSEVYVTREPCHDCKVTLFDQEYIRRFIWPGGELHAESWKDLSG
jgi:dCMP deaminase